MKSSFQRKHKKLGFKTSSIENTTARFRIEIQLSVNKRRAIILNRLMLQTPYVVVHKCISRGFHPLKCHIKLFIFNSKSLLSHLYAGWLVSVRNGDWLKRACTHITRFYLCIVSKSLLKRTNVFTSTATRINIRYKTIDFPFSISYLVAKR